MNFQALSYCKAEQVFQGLNNGSNTKYYTLGQFICIKALASWALHFTTCACRAVSVIPSSLICSIYWYDIYGSDLRKQDLSQNIILILKLIFSFNFNRLHMTLKLWISMFNMHNFCSSVGGVILSQQDHLILSKCYLNLGQPEDCFWGPLTWHLSIHC